jgi:predicted metal-dependent peptidase
MKENIRLLEIKTAMLLHVPFFASLLLDMMKLHVGKFPERFPPGNETAATDGKTIWIDEDFLNKLSLPEGVFLICHEVGHAMWQHMSRGKKYLDLGFEGRQFNPMLWNIAGDYVINDMLVEARIGKMPSVGLLDKNVATQEDQVDEVYKKLEKKENEKGKGGKQPNDSKGGHGGFDHHILSPGESNETEWKRACKTAADAAKAVGKLPGALERFVDQLLNPKIPWQEKLRYHVMRAIGRDAHTWAKPNRRRLINQGIIMPSYTGFGAGEVVVAVDTSGSIGAKELTVFLTELQNILDVAKPTNVWVLGVDAKVHDVTELSPGDDLRHKAPPLRGGGGTSFVPTFDWVAEQGLEPAALIYFTDLYGGAPDQPPSYPVIWCATTDQKHPWGERVDIDLSEYKEE